MYVCIHTHTQTRSLHFWTLHTHTHTYKAHTHTHARTHAHARHCYLSDPANSDRMISLIDRRRRIVRLRPKSDTFKVLYAHICVCVCQLLCVTHRQKSQLRYTFKVMYAYMCLCVWVNVYTHVFVRVSECIHTCVCVCEWVYTHMCLCVWLNVCTHVFVCVIECIHTCVCVWVNVCTHVFVCVCVSEWYATSGEFTTDIWSKCCVHTHMHRERIIFITHGLKQWTIIDDIYTHARKNMTALLW